MWPQVWRPLTAFLITKPKFGILLDPYFCYQYGSGLERESARFSAPGDFAVYTAFVGGIIAVSDAVVFWELVLSVPPRFFGCMDTPVCNTKSPRHICPRSLSILAVAVPGIEEEYPCASPRSAFTIHRAGCGVVSVVGMPAWKAQWML
jgi:hypothetical protein